MAINHAIHTIGQLNRPAELRTKEEFGIQRGGDDDLRYQVDPFAELYYDKESSEIQGLSDRQIVGYDEPMINVCERLQEFSFVFAVFRPTSGYLAIEEEDQSAAELDVELGEEYKKSARKVDKEALGQSDGATLHDGFIQFHNWNPNRIGATPEEFGKAHSKYRDEILELERKGHRWNVVEWWMLKHKDTKIMAYSTLAEMEERLGDLIREAYTDSEQIITQTSAIEGRPIDRWSEAGKPGKYGILEFMYFRNLVKVCRESEAVLNLIDMNVPELRSYTDGVNDLRNDVMHPINTVFEEKSDIAEFIESITNVEEFLSRTENCL
ncbi:hypothetical protein [Halosimplex pelagicum]|uniref:Uncharacterized protein n=1 Tax=Halosimplex pelagicum TaxID=869886 RepID=A0A7D5T6E2_9EURY|nr:hypothetical protein [Halosimplex pelagicum]QLH83248.1 hypothetical protein HZS54_17135 [Halosimplex pelagicum]